MQIDTIHVIERAHHHILWTRLPKYRPSDLQQAQSVDKTVMEAWTHALSYVPTSDFEFHLPRMRRVSREPGSWFDTVTDADIRRVKAQLSRHESLSVDDFDDDPGGKRRVDKDHPWASRKPSKRVLEYLFHRGDLVIAKRQGMRKHYALASRHFGWKKVPEPASAEGVLAHRILGHLRSQGIGNLESICHLSPKLKSSCRKLLEDWIAHGKVRQVEIEGVDGDWWMLDSLWNRYQLLTPQQQECGTRFLSPFDPLVIRRKWTKAIFDFEYQFEAYLPQSKRKFGYFGLPILDQGELVGIIDLKADRGQKKILVQSQHLFRRLPGQSRRIKEALRAFAEFQFFDT